MIATVTVQHPQRTSSSSDIQYMRASNLAGAPLLVPRRITRSHTLPASHSTSCNFLEQGDSDSDASSSSVPATSKSTTRVRRGRAKGLRINGFNPSNNTTLSLPPPEASKAGQIYFPVAKQVTEAKSQRKEAAIAAPRPLMYIPGTLRLSVETIRSHMLIHSTRPDPRSNSGNGAKSAPPAGINRAGAAGPPPIIRKKSGQPVKPSLKSSRTSTRGNLSIVTIGSSSKSEPPTPKAVHFDTKLEHVKLFLAEQKPLAVSRDGSPTEDTSGTDSDFPSFIYGESDIIRRSRKKLVMRSINVPSRPNLEADIALEDFCLNSDGTSILGKVRVRNMAFAKSVTVRFTFDSWQTTSEVTGQYAESIDSHFDRFTFTIRLNDLLARIEGKTFVMAIRYNVAGKEFWDNNNHQNYVATFTKAKVVPETRKSDDEDASDVENLRNRLEQVILQDKKGNPSTCLSKKLATSRSKETDPPSFKSNISFSSRYDFTTSLRNPTTWKSAEAAIRGSPPKHTQTLSEPLKSTIPSTPPSSIPFLEKISSVKVPVALPVSAPSFEERPCLGSPRDIDEVQARLVLSPLLRPNDSSNGALSLGAAQSRNHRRGYFDATGPLSVDSFVKMTPPGTPPSKSLELSAISLQSAPSRYYSLPPLIPSGNSLSPSSTSSSGSEFARSAVIRQFPSTRLPDRATQALGSALGESSGDSELSTSSPTTPTSSRSPTPSPKDPFTKGTALPPLDDDTFALDSDLGLVQSLPPISPGTHYRQFLNKFCFFTGTPAVHAGPGAMERPPTASAHPPATNSTEVDKSQSDSVAQAVLAGDWGSRTGLPVPP